MSMEISSNYKDYNPSKPIYIQTVWGVGYRFNKNLIA